MGRLTERIVESDGTSLAAKESILSIFPSCSLKITDVLALLLLLRQNPTERWIDIVISHMYPAVVQSGKKKEKEIITETPRRSFNIIQ